MEILHDHFKNLVSEDKLKNINVRQVGNFARHIVFIVVQEICDVNRIQI